jgi:nucleoside-diphosphate-sugar epimerase
MRILLIGGNGFIGTPLVRELRVSGHQVAVLHRNAKPQDSEIVAISGDQDHLAESRKEIERFAPEAIVDLILSSGDQARQLVEAARGLVGHVVALSSMDVYRAWGVVQQTEPGPLEALPLTEDSPLRTVRQAYPPETVKALRSIFSWVNEQYDKIAVEQTVMSSPGVSCTVLRLPMIYGPGDRLHRFFPLLKRIADGRSAIIFAANIAAWRTPRGYVDNVAHAIALATTSDHARGRVYNICEEPAFSEVEWQTRIARLVGWPGKFVVLPRERTPKHLLQPGNAAQHVVASSQRIRKELGYKEVVSVDEAILRTAAWERENPPGTVPLQQFDYAAEDAALTA